MTYPPHTAVTVSPVSSLNSSSSNGRITSGPRPLAIAAFISARLAADRERREREEARRASLDRRIYRVVGVTFDNDDGPARNRQEILREIAAEGPRPRAFTLEVYDFEGEPAVGVFYHGEQVGNIAKKDLPDVLPLMDRYAGLSDFSVTGGGDKCGLEIAVYFKKSA